MTTYNPNDAVEHNGSSYVCIATTSSEPPSADWQLMAAKGTDSTVPGPPGQDSTVPGPPGADGTNGLDGADSTVPGPQGPAGPACPLTDLTDVTITTGEQGDLLVRNAAGEWVNKHHGTAGQALITGGNAADPSWAAPVPASHEIDGHAATTALTVPKGGTGAATLTGVLKGNGTGAITGGATAADVGAAIMPPGVCMDGSAAILDNMSGAAFTLAGTPTTGALLGATAPDIAATKYTSCYFPTPWAAGQAFSMMFVVKTAWAGNDGVEHAIFDCNGWGANSIYLQKHANNNLYLTVYNSAGSYKLKYGAVNGTNWAAGTHIVIITVDAANTQQLFLDGTALTGTSGSTGRESAVAANTYFGSWNNASSPVTGLMLAAFWGRVLPANEITSLSATTAWTQMTPYRGRAADVGAIALPASPEQGDLLYYNGSAWVRLVHGNAGEVLASGGNAANPAWAASSAPGVHATTHSPGGTDPLTELVGGWVASGQTWTYESAAAPNYLFSEPIDATGKYSAGMRIRCTQNGSTKYGIIVAVGAYSGGKTIITVYCGTDYTLGATITVPFYSTVKAPFGFPLNPAKWTVTGGDASSYSTAAPTQNVWYNALSLALPISPWRIYYECTLSANKATTGTSVFISATFSDANNTELSALYSVFETLYGASATIRFERTVHREFPLTLAAAATYYLNYRTIVASQGATGIRGDLNPTTITAINGYL